jgi:hypothetical protein
MLFHFVVSFSREGRYRTSAFHINFCFAIDLVTAGAAGHGIAKQRLQNSSHRIGLLILRFRFGLQVQRRIINAHTTFSHIHSCAYTRNYKEETVENASLDE